jgi:hypothetical protein
MATTEGSWAVRRSDNPADDDARPRYATILQLVIFVVAVGLVLACITAALVAEAVVQIASVGH